jgi:flagellar hook-length control protein FliK
VANINAAASVNAADVLNNTASNVSGDRTNVKNSGDFKNTLKDAFKDVSKSDNSNKNVKASRTSEDSVTVNDSSKDQNLDEKLKGQLEKAGFSQEEIEKIEDEIKQGDVDPKNLSYILNMLFSYNGNLNDSELVDKISDLLSDNISSDILKNLQAIISDNTAGSKNIIDKIVEKNIDGLADILQKLGISGEFSEKLEAGILSKVSQGTNLEQNIYNKIKSEINSALAAQMSTDTTGESLNAGLAGTKMQDIIQNGQSNMDNSTVSSQNDQLSTNNNPISSKDGNMPQNNSDKSSDKGSGNLTSSGDEILKKIIEGGDGDKISKAANFMTQFSNINGDNTVENLKNLVINKNSFTSDIIKTLKYMDLNNVKQLTVKVNPRELGEITINLVMEAGKMKAAITASNQDTYNLLNYNLQDLSNKIQGNDIRVQSFSLNLYNEDTTYFRDESRKGQQNKGNGSGKNMTVDSISGEEAPQEDYYEENNVNILA